MGKCFIYIIGSTKSKEQYIGQQARENSSSPLTRPLEHFSGLYHYVGEEKDKFVTSGGRNVDEGSPFVNGLRHTTLDEVTLTIYSAPYFGIPVEIGKRFGGQGTTNEKYRNDVANEDIDFSKISENAMVNAAEILHIYYARKHGIPLLQAQMGGQNPNLYYKDPNQNIILNREMSPDQMVSIIDAYKGDNAPLARLQEQFDDAFRRNVLQDPRYKAKLEKALILGDKKTMFKQLQKATLEFLGEKDGKSHNNTHLETIIRQMQDETGIRHMYFKVSWPDKHDDPNAFDITIEDERVKTFASAISNQLIKKKNQIEKHAKTPLEAVQMIEEILKGIEGQISVGTFITVKNLIRDVSFDNWSIGPGEDYTHDTDFINALKRRSYWYFMHFANEYFEQYNNGAVPGNSDFTDEEGNVYKRIHLPYCINYIGECYRQQGIRNTYTENYTIFRQTFGRQMLTVYTKNHGSLNGSSLKMIRAGDNNGEPVYMGATELFDVESIDLLVPKNMAYSFSRETWSFMDQNLDSLNITDVTCY